jgi:hypothetical protein
MLKGLMHCHSLLEFSWSFVDHLLEFPPGFTRSLDMALDIAFEIIPVRFNAVGCRQGQLIDTACINLYRLHQIHFT